MIVLSLQSGTSADGIDVAVVDVAALDADERPAVGLCVLHAETVAWSAEGRDRILAVSAGEALTAGGFCELDTKLGQAFADASAGGMAATGVVPDLVVSHGQTLFHWVEGGHARGTLQLGEPAWIAEPCPVEQRHRPVVQGIAHVRVPGLPQLARGARAHHERRRR